MPVSDTNPSEADQSEKETARRAREDAICAATLALLRAGMTCPISIRDFRGHKVTLKPYGEFFMLKVSNGRSVTRTVYKAEDAARAFAVRAYSKADFKRDHPLEVADYS